MITGRWAQRPSSPMSTDSNMSPAITHRRPRRHKQNQCGEQANQPSDIFNDGMEKSVNGGLETAGRLNTSSLPPDSCMPLGFSSHTAHCDYKVRGATLPRMGSGENRGRRGSTGTHRVKDATCEQRENQDKHRSPPRGKGSGRNRQHSGSRWMDFSFTLLKCEEQACWSVFPTVCPLEFGDIFPYNRPSFPSGQTQREPDGANSSSLTTCGDSRTKQREVEEVKPWQFDKHNLYNV